MSFRRLFTGGYGPLLALGALVGVLWAGSYRSIAAVKLPVSPSETRWQFTSYHGTVTIALIDNHPTSADAAVIVRRDNPSFAAVWDARCATASLGGFSFEDAQVWVTDGDNELVVRRLSAVNLPYWALLALALVGPLHGAYVIARAHRRTTHNQCGECGYDLGDGAVCQACAARTMVVSPTHRMQLVRSA
jgi:hypothetical protein